MIRNAKDTRDLVWDSNCGINLANYLTDRKEKIGIIAKGCDSRNIVTHILENKIKREQLVIIGVPCKGMIDKRNITAGCSEVKSWRSWKMTTRSRSRVQGFEDDFRPSRTCCRKTAPSASTAIRSFTMNWWPIRLKSRPMWIAMRMSRRSKP